MAKKKRPPKLNSNPLFDLEDDAEQIFTEFLANEGEINPKDDHLSATPKPPRGSNHPKTREFSVDLHGKTRREVRDVLLATVERLKQTAGGSFKLRVITGKGRHSGEQGPVIADEAFHFLQRTYGPAIVTMDSPPGETQVGGLPWRGHFDVTFLFP